MINGGIRPFCRKTMGTLIIQICEITLTVLSNNVCWTYSLMRYSGVLRSLGAWMMRLAAILAMDALFVKKFMQNCHSKCYFCHCSICKCLSLDLQEEMVSKNEGWRKTIHSRNDHVTSALLMKQIPRGFIRCDYFIITHFTIAYFGIWWLFTLKNGYIRRSEIK